MKNNSSENNNNSSASNNLYEDAVDREDLARSNIKYYEERNHELLYLVMLI